MSKKATEMIEKNIELSSSRNYNSGNNYYRSKKTTHCVGRVEVDWNFILKYVGFGVMYITASLLHESTSVFLGG